MATSTGTSDVQILAEADLPPPVPGDIVGVTRPYFIGPFDKLMIDVYGVPELSARAVQADASGRISFPLVGTVDAAGKTPEQLAAILAEGLRANYIRNPQVQVNLTETVSQTITVDGQVREPGIFPVVGEMTLMRAIARARGTTEFAKLQDVVVFRTVNGQKMAAVYNLKAIRRGVYGDPDLYANDVVVVGDSKSTRALRDVLTFLPALAAPIVLLLQTN
jgi:polysaccharide export outer membrane protein